MKTFMLSFLIVLSFALKGQTISGFETELNTLKNSYINLLHENYVFKDIENDLYDFSSQFWNLSHDVNDYIITNKLQNDTNAQALDKEIELWGGFTSRKPYVFCLADLNDIISKYGVDNVLLYNENDERIYSVLIGNFKFLYSYSKENYEISYNVEYKTRSNDKTNLHVNFYTQHKAIDIFDIIENSSIIITSVKIEYKDKIDSEECENEFPRF